MNKIVLVVLCYIVNVANGYAEILNATADKILSKYPSVELGQVISQFMPEKSDDITWSYRVNAPVFWITDGFETNGTYSFRKGVIRINVQGKDSYVLRDNSYELPWTIKYSTFSSPKFGLEAITFFPGIEPDDQCFGTLYSGCSFTTENSMKVAGITYKKLCEKQKGNYIKIGYELSKTNKLKTYASLDNSSGTGGDTSSFSLIFGDKAKNRVCDVDDTL